MTKVRPTFHLHSVEGYHLKLLEKAIAGGKISESEAELLNKFIKARDVSQLRKTKIAQTLISWRIFFDVSYADATIDDLHDARNQLSSAKSTKGKPYSQNTKNDHIQVLKSFYKWLIKRKISGISMEELEEIKAPGADINTTKADELLTFDDISKMINSCKTHRDRAIIALLYESGGRIGEVANLRWDDIKFDSDGVKLYITDTKTGTTRYTRIFDSLEYISGWRNGYYGSSPTGDNFVFVTNSNEPMEYRAISQVVSRAGVRAGLKKRVHPHLFRKSRITAMVRQNYQESIIKQIHWGNLDTNMFQIYVKLSERDIDVELLRKRGVEVPEDDVITDLDKQCPYCFAMNAPHSRFCHMCARALTKDAVKDVEDTKNEIENTPEYNAMVQMIKDQIMRKDNL